MDYIVQVLALDIERERCKQNREARQAELERERTQKQASFVISEDQSVDEACQIEDIPEAVSTFSG